MPLPVLPSHPHPHPSPGMAPAPAAPALSSMSIWLDAIILHSWRDNSAFGMSAASPYCGMELQVCCWSAKAAKGRSTHILARYPGGKLKKDALYQLKGRFFVDMNGGDGDGRGGASYLHVDEAVRFQGPGVLRSFRTPQFWVVGEVVRTLGGGDGWCARQRSGGVEVAHPRPVEEGHGVRAECGGEARGGDGGELGGVGGGVVLRRGPHGGA
ncbi:hypothetical protein PZA11_006036 [Diplocarpon coronariae]